MEYIIFLGNYSANFITQNLQKYINMANKKQTDTNTSLLGLYSEIA